MLLKSGRAGSAVWLETGGESPFNLMSDESTSWRECRRRAYVPARFIAGWGGFDGEGSARPRVGRLGV